MKRAFSAGVPLFSGKCCRVYERQTSRVTRELASESERKGEKERKKEGDMKRDRARYLFAAERRRIAPRLSVGVNQWPCACNLQYARVRIHLHTHIHIRGNFHRGACGCDGCTEGFTNSRGWAFTTAIIGSTLMHAT